MTTLLDLTDSAVPHGKVTVPPRPGKEPKAPVTVNGAEITEEAIRTEAQHHPAENPAAAFQAAAQALVVRELLLQEVARRGLSAEAQIICEGKRETDEDAQIRTLLDQEVDTPRADDEACRRYYTANKQKFCSETLYEARHILFAATNDNHTARAAARQKAEAAIAALKDSPDRFAELAASQSDCPSRMQGGNLGQLTKGSTVPEFETVLFTLEEGQLAPEPVSTPYGYHVIRLERIVPGRQLPFDMVRERISAWLEASSWSRAVAQYVGILAGQADIKGIVLNTADGPLVQ